MGTVVITGKRKEVRGSSAREYRTAEVKSTVQQPDME